MFICLARTTTLTRIAVSSRNTIYYFIICRSRGTENSNTIFQLQKCGQLRVIEIYYCSIHTNRPRPNKCGSNIFKCGIICFSTNTKPLHIDSMYIVYEKKNKKIHTNIYYIQYNIRMYVYGYTRSIDAVFACARDTFNKTGSR